MHIVSLDYYMLNITGKCLKLLKNSCNLLIIITITKFPVNIVLKDVYNGIQKNTL